jgi:hypothetical protein
MMMSPDDVKDISFVGRDVVGIQTLVEKLMDVVFPPDERDDDEDVKKMYDKGMEVWNMWKDLWRLLNNKMDSDDHHAEARN